MIKRLRCMLIKEFLQMLRDPRMRAIIFVAPVVQMMVIAFALTTDVTRIRTGLVDLDGTPASREMVAAFTGSGHFNLLEQAFSSPEIQRMLDRGRVRVVIHLPAGFESDLRAGRTASLQLIVDGTDSNTAAIVSGYATAVVETFNQAELSGSAPVPGVQIETRAWFNPNLESRYYFVPGLIAVMMMVVSLILTSIAIVREKEIGTMEQVMVTPIRRLEFIFGKTIPYLITGYITMTLMFAAAMLIFGVRIQGSWLLLYVLAGIYLTGNLGIALSVSVSAATQQQALLTAFFIVLPGVLLSGFMFPIRNMPQPVQILTMLNPMRWFLEILHGIALKGAGIRTLWQAISALTALALFFIALAAIRFRKTLD